MRDEAFYRKLIAQGQSPSMADILASRRAPGCKTDTQHVVGIGTLDKQLGVDAEYIAYQAQRHGYKPSYNDIYDAGAARFPGDPQAFHKAHESRAHIRKICEQRGIGFSGSSMEIAARNDTPPAPDIPLAEPLIKECIRKESKADPSFARKKRAEKREIVIKKYGAPPK